MNNLIEILIVLIVNFTAFGVGFYIGYHVVRVLIEHIIIPFYNKYFKS